MTMKESKQKIKTGSVVVSNFGLYFGKVIKTCRDGWHVKVLWFRTHETSTVSVGNVSLNNF